jgi:hypothetical protein
MKLRLISKSGKVDTKKVKEFSLDYLVELAIESFANPLPLLLGLLLFD